MDERLRDLERRAASGDPEALLAWVRARRRLEGQAPPRYREGDRVQGELLAAVLRAALAVMGRREIEILRDAKVSERDAGRYIGAFRDLLKGQGRAWVWLVRWGRLLPVVELDDLASVAGLSSPWVGRRAQRRDVREGSDPGLEPSCNTCVYRLWAVGAGAGVRCASDESPLGRGGVVPSLAYACDAYAPRS